MEKHIVPVWVEQFPARRAFNLFIIGNKLGKKQDHGASS